MDIINNNTNKQQKNSTLYLAVVSVNLLGFVAGTAYSWTSPVLPKLNSYNNNATTTTNYNPLLRPISAFEESWIVSLISLGAILGPFIGGATSDRIGRKKTLIAFTLPMIVSFLILAYAQQVELYYFARFLIGIGMGLVYSIVPIYVGEIADDQNRGFFGCFLGLSYTIGSVCCYATGPYVTVCTLCLLCVVPLIAFLALFVPFAPESPYYLALVNRSDDAKKSLRKLRNGSITKEMLGIEIYLTDRRDPHQHINGNNINTSYFDLLKSNVLIRTLLIGLALMFFQQFSGASIVVSYLQSIFNATGTTNIPSDISAIIIGLIQFTSNLTTSQLVDRIGRKTLLLISIVGMFISHLILGSYFVVATNTSWWWLPIAALILYVTSYNLGMGPISWVILGELFSPDHKAHIITLTVSFCYVSAFLTTLLFPYVTAMVGMAGTYYLLALFCGLGVVVMGWIVPETKGKSLHEIQLLLNK